MLDVSHRAVMSPELEREWRRRKSRYSTSWLAAMRSRRRVVLVEPDTEARGVLAKAVRTVGTLTAGQEAAIEKEGHLVAAAWTTGETVASCDDKMRRLLCVLSAAEPRLRAVVWVNPDVHDGAATRWLEAGARPEPSRRLAPPSP